MKTKTKNITGWLCRDSKSRHGSIIFFPDETNPVPTCNNGFWDQKQLSEFHWKEWTLQRWKEEYDLKPPACGKKFRVEIEL